jgi:hypothetical protein
MPTNDVMFKFSRPSGAPARQPSRVMTDALQRLSESVEMQALVAEARAQGRKVVGGLPLCSRTPHPHLPRGGTAGSGVK